MNRPQKITFAEMREMGVRADQWSDAVRLSDLEPRFVCQGCGQRGAPTDPTLVTAASR